MLKQGWIVWFCACIAAFRPPVRRHSHCTIRCAESTLTEDRELIETINTKAPELVRLLVLSQSEVGRSIAQANRISGGSAKLEKAEMLEVGLDGTLSFDVEVAKRKGYFSSKLVTERTSTQVKLWEERPDDIRRRLIEIACSLGANAEAVNLCSVVSINNLWLNNVPAAAKTRKYFTDAASKALVAAIKEGKHSKMSMVLRPPELDDELDTYRVGTLLEMARSMALAVVRDLGLRVRISVQQAQGTGTFQGLPLSLNGVRRLLEGMDWGPSAAELFENKYIRFGALSSAENDQDDLDDVFIILCPQSTVGASVVKLLQDLTSATGNKPVIIFNPKLQDVQSSQGVMSVRGRADRIAYSESFYEIFRFTTVVPTGRTFFPILGSVIKSDPTQPYLVYRRIETGDQSLLADSAAKARAVDQGLLSESYLPLAAFNELPDNGQVLNVLKQ